MTNVDAMIINAVSPSLSGRQAGAQPAVALLPPVEKVERKEEVIRGPGRWGRKITYFCLILSDGPSSGPSLLLLINFA